MCLVRILIIARDPIGSGFIFRKLMNEFFFQVLGKGVLPKQPVIVKARFFSRYQIRDFARGQVKGSLWTFQS
mgnify:CR=1 FL=1